MVFKQREKRLSLNPNTAPTMSASLPCRICLALSIPLLRFISFPEINFLSALRRRKAKLNHMVSIHCISHVSSFNFHNSLWEIFNYFYLTAAKLWLWEVNNFLKISFLASISKSFFDSFHILLLSSYVFSFCNHFSIQAFLFFPDRSLYSWYYFPYSWVAGSFLV